jgi:hypothetical protein
MSKNRGKVMKKLVAGICVLALAALACNFVNQGSMPSSPSRSAIATVVAQTMQAVESASPTVPTVLNTPILVTPSPSATPEAVIVISTQCRNGPGENYQSITDVSPNQNAVVLGKDSSDSYWLIQTSSGECWVAAQDLTIIGNTQNIPEVTPSPSTSSGVPARPGKLTAVASCNPTSTTNVLNWTDNANNENGYYVFRNGNQVADLPANSTTYTDTVNISPGTQITYSVEAYNEVGASPQLTITSFCG